MVYDGDMIVLQGQEKIFLSKSMEDGTDVNQQYSKLTFTPTQADRLVLAFRNWLKKHGNSQPDWFGPISGQPLPSTVLTKRQVCWATHCLSLSCFSLILFISVAISISISLYSLCISISITLYIAISLPISIYLSMSIYLYFYICLFPVCILVFLF